ncbi:MAG: hypothetical protein QHH05_09585, partial [Syntrophomonadaceae bacterium]|nr:hypothetical protein [Syntrophomonadaceae bacterium]
NDRVAVTIHVYGAPVRKGYINYFSPHDNTCRRVFPPQVLHKVLAIRTLGSVAEPWAEELLSRRLQADEPDYLREEYRRALARLEGR